MNPGKLRHRIELQKKKLRVNKGGFEKEEWITFAEVWASVNNLYGKEFYEAAAVQMSDIVKFKIRFRQDIDAAMRILFRGEAYEITHVDNLNYLNRELILKALRIKKEGSALEL